MSCRQAQWKRRRRLCGLTDAGVGSLLQRAASGLCSGLWSGNFGGFLDGKRKNFGVMDGIDRGQEPLERNFRVKTTSLLISTFASKVVTLDAMNTDPKLLDDDLAVL